MSTDELSLKLTEEESGALSELTNISMGAAASTLSLMLGGDVDVSSPQVQEYDNLGSLLQPFDAEGPTTILKVQYTKGLQGTSIFILKNADVRYLAGKMMGSEETADGLTSMELEAIGELMNQLLNASATSLASMIRQPVELTAPQVVPYSDDALAEFLPSILMEPFVACSVELHAKGGPDLSIIEIKLTAEAKRQVANLLVNASAGPIGDDEEDDGNELFSNMDDLIAGIQKANAPPPVPAGVGGGAGGRGGSAAGTQVDPVMVRPVQFSSFDNQPSVAGEENRNLELVMDITLSLTVELGRTELSIKDVLELTRGSVVELERVAGEPVDLMANGKLIAKGEVVVIEDNFGLRITSIVSPAERLRGLT